MSIFIASRAVCYDSKREDKCDKTDSKREDKSVTKLIQREGIKV